MKDLTRAAELLAELRALADSDFERHRIDVLERDLTSPPQVEVIDETHQRFDGTTYYKAKDGHYARRAGLHVDVWRYYHGDIPNDGTRYEVHHDDWNPANNAPTNLVLKTASEHRKIHRAPEDHCVVKESQCASCGKIFVGRIVFGHTAHYCPDCRQNIYHKTCPVCGKNFDTDDKNGRYCSRACASKAFSERSRETRQCPTCGKNFEVVKSSLKRYCSTGCAHKAISKQSSENRTCPICGKIFETQKHNKKKCCSFGCGLKYREQNRKAGD